MNYRVLILIAVILVVIAGLIYLKTRKEKYTSMGPGAAFTETPALTNVVQMPSEETHDTLAYALGGLSN